MKPVQPEPATKKDLPSLGTSLARALRLRCPLCGEGKLFRRWFSMYKNCNHCHLKYERAPGYFLGSTYINYAVTAVSITILYVSLHFGADFSNRQLTPWLGAYCILFPLVFFRFARAFWLAMDSFFDSTDLDFDKDD